MLLRIALLCILPYVYVCAIYLSRRSDNERFCTITSGECDFSARQDYFYPANDTHCCQRERVKVNKRCSAITRLFVPLRNQPTRIRSRLRYHDPYTICPRRSTRNSRSRDTVHYANYTATKIDISQRYTISDISSHSCCNNDTSKWLVMAREACARLSEDQNYNCY